MLFTNEHIQWIRKELATIEKEKAITDKLLSFIRQHKLFKLIIPEALGGKSLTLPEAVQIFQDASYVDGNFGWLVTIGSGGGMFTPNFTVEAAETYYSPENAVIAGSGYPAGIATKVTDGYIVNGEWFYCSGSQYASIFTATCKVEPINSEPPSLLSFIFEPEQVEVIEDWSAFGLKGTSSHTIRVTNQFVPDERTFSIFETKNSFSELIHHFPFMAFSEASFAAIVFGIGKHFLEEVRNMIEKNKDIWSKGNFDRYSFMKNKLEKEEARWKLAEKEFQSIVISTWNQHEKRIALSEEVQRTFRTICKKGVSTVLTCADHLFRYVGMQAIMEHRLLNRIWRDLHTASQHVFLTPYTEEEVTPYHDI